MEMTRNASGGTPKTKKKFGYNFIRELPFHIMIWPGLTFAIVFAYLPMFGVVMAFQDFKPLLSFGKSEWVGLYNFKYMLNLPGVWQSVGNTLYIAASKIVLGILFPLVMALLLNEVSKKWFKRGVQTIVFLPFFLSWSVLGGVLKEVFALDGFINNILVYLGMEKPIFFMGSNVWFPLIIIFSDIWKNVGYNMIIYLAAITGINPNLYEAAAIDGCSRWQQTCHITIPGIAPMIILLSVLSLGSLLNAGFGQVMIMYNSLVYKSSDIIDTLVYRVGILNGQYSLSAAVGLFKSVVSLILVGSSYYIAYKTTDYRIF
jgi:putative aldouronate transport system permease protein